MNPMLRWTAGLVLLVSVAGFAIASWVRSQEGGHAVDVQSATVSRGPLAAFVKATGVVDAPVSYSVRAPQTARLLKLLPRVGQRVQRGETLVLLDSEAASERLRNAQAQVKAQQAQVHSAELDVRAEESIWRAGGQTRQAVDQAEAQLAGARALLDAARSDARAARIQLATYEVRAPANGVVTTVSANAGEFVQAGAPLLSVASQDALEVTLKVDQVWADQVRVGQSVELAVEGAAHRVGITRITRIEPEILKDGSSYYMVAVAPMPAQGFAAKLNQQLSARILTVSRSGVLRVPLDAVTEKDGIDVVRVAVNGRLHLQRVRTGIQDGQQIEIVDGLVEGQQVILPNVRQPLAEGMPVRLTGSGQP